MKQSLCTGADFSASFEVKDPISALTHFVAFWAAMFGMPLLLIRGACFRLSLGGLTSLAVFMLSMLLLYGASTAYHTFRISPHVDKILKKLDHMMIFVLIAGSYTPVCTLVLHNATGYRMLASVWAVALVGMLFKAFWVTCPKVVSSVIYIGMGWIVVFALGMIRAALAPGAFAWLLAGGIAYTVGGVIYALRFPLLEKALPGFGAHEVFHLFVMLGSFCHYMMMFCYVVRM